MSLKIGDVVNIDGVVDGRLVKVEAVLRDGNFIGDDGNIYIYNDYMMDYEVVGLNLEEIKLMETLRCH